MCESGYFSFKGQLFFKCPFGVFKSSKNNEIFSRISALASKKRSNQKNKGHFIPLIGGFYFDSLTQLFWSDLFLEARAEILEKISLVLKLTDL